ncbi:hypothetical protein HK097_003850 [Rhizophlyctis rosea]|uniref:Uncharacterized protein n=1 Tax=Rhizophlyctis rosea TaxID=64517 RepID=A0AAD5S1W7_9FUNG|nr:hypothetical protein HK097_003850 [Rhizophlyctis rosea]
MEKKMRAMFSAEEVQDVYQETADKLSDAEARIENLEAQVKEQKAANQKLTRDIHHLRTTYEAPLGEYNCLLLRHEELCKKHAATQKEFLLLQMQHDKERTGHRRLATILRKQAMDAINEEAKAERKVEAVKVEDMPGIDEFGGVLVNEDADTSIGG